MIEKTKNKKECPDCMGTGVANERQGASGIGKLKQCNRCFGTGEVEAETGYAKKKNIHMEEVPVLG